MNERMINTKEAIKMTERKGYGDVTLATIINWCMKYEGIGKKVGGRWRIDKKVLEEFLEGALLPEKN